MLAVNKTVFKNSHREVFRMLQDNSTQEILVDMKLTTIQAIMSIIIISPLQQPLEVNRRDCITPDQTALENHL